MRSPLSYATRSLYSAGPTQTPPRLGRPSTARCTHPTPTRSAARASPDHPGHGSPLASPPGHQEVDLPVSGTRTGLPARPGRRRSSNPVLQGPRRLAPPPRRHRPRRPRGRGRPNPPANPHVARLRERARTPGARSKHGTSSASSNNTTRKYELCGFTGFQQTHTV